MINILNFGSINIDKVFTIDHIVLPGETISASTYSENAGGKGVNQSGALAKAGQKVFHSGTIGQDGLFILELLKDCGVDTQFVKTTAKSTGQAIIQVSKKGQNSIILKGGGNEEVEKEDIDKVLSNFNEGDYLIIQNEISNVDYIIDRAFEKKMIICFNPSPFTEEIRSFSLSKISYFFINEIEAAQISNSKEKMEYKEILESLIKQFPTSKIIMTVGKDGAFYKDSNVECFEPIIDIKVVDTTAAGDTFMGYFIASIIKGLTPHDALKKATEASTLTVSRNGALQSIPYGKEIF